MKYGEKYLCKRYRLLSFLRAKGFYPELVLPDKDNPRYNVWIFNNSEELEAAVAEFLSNCRSRQEQ